MYSLVEAWIGKRLAILKSKTDALHFGIVGSSLNSSPTKASTGSASLGCFRGFYRDHTPILTLELVRFGLLEAHGEQRRETTSCSRQETFWRL